MKWLLSTISVLIILALILAAPINRAPLAEREYFQQMQKQLDTLHLPKYRSTDRLKVGWSMFNLIPDHPMPMAGYRPRNSFETVHDSLYTRIIAIDNGSLTSYIISVDLLLFPPALRTVLNNKIDSLGRNNEFVYLSATHTHNGLGGWERSMAGEFALGNYDNDWVERTANSIITHMHIAKQSMKYGSLSYWESNAPEYVSNRLDPQFGDEDGKLRGISIVRDDSSRAILVTYSAHPTSISSKNLSLSGDYPAEIIRQLNQQGYTFSMFLAGMVGSHRLDGLDETDFERTRNAGKSLAEKIAARNEKTSYDSLHISVAHIPIQFGPSQLRIAKNWHIRDWVFRLIGKPLEGEVTFLELGNIVLLGMPCDFSGEIFVDHKLGEYAEQHDINLIITSFNGYYTGYVTSDEHYDIQKKEEVMTMNWSGPYYGEYYASIIKRLLDKGSYD